jgi:hypothetical protein
MIKGKYIYKAHVDGDCTLEQQIEQVNSDSIHGYNVHHKFEEALKYDVTRTVCNILGNSVIKYKGFQDPFCESLQRNLTKIYFALHDSGQCFIKLDDEGNVKDVNKSIGNIKVVDPAYTISKITQRHAAEQQLRMYGLVTNVSYSVLDERGMFGVFSPEKGEIIKESQTKKMYDAFKTIFGAKKHQRKFAITEIPMKYSGVSMPIAELQLLEKEKNAVSNVARIFGIQEDMILSGSTFDNKENAIIQTYTDFKGMIYDWITQIEDEKLASFRSVDGYEITFPGVPQMNQQNTVAQ